MATTELRVSTRGQMSLPAGARHRWHLAEGGAVQVVDLGDVLLIAPTHKGGLSAVLRDALKDAGGYAALAEAVGGDDPDLA